MPNLHAEAGRLELPDVSRAPLGAAFLLRDPEARYGHVSQAENIALSFKNATLCE